VEDGEVGSNAREPSPVGVIGAPVDDSLLESVFELAVVGAEVVGRGVVVDWVGVGVEVTGFGDVGDAVGAGVDEGAKVKGVDEGAKGVKEGEVVETGVVEETGAEVVGLMVALD
jgi:hypothetical protein